MAREKREKGTGHVLYKPNGRVAVTVSSPKGYVDPKTGNVKRKKVTADTEEEALRLATEEILAWERWFEEDFLPKQGKTLTFGEYILDYMEREVRGTISESAYLSYKRDIKTYVERYAIYRMQLQNLNVKVVKVYYDCLTQKYVPSSIKVAVQLCQRTADWLVGRHLLQENYFRLIKPTYEVPDEVELLPEDSKKYKEVFTSEDIQKFMDAMHQHIKSDYVCVAIFLLETGIRPSELSALQNSDIDLENRIISVTKTVATRLKKGSTAETELYAKVTKNHENRVIPILSDICIDAIKEMQTKTAMYCKDNPKNLLYPIFGTGNFRTSETMEVGFKKVCDMLDIDRDVHITKGGQKKGLCLYACRHTFETRLEEQGYNPVVIGAMLGHTPTVGLKHYTHIEVSQMASQLKSPTTLLSTLSTSTQNKDTTSTPLGDLTEEQEIELVRKLMKKYADRL